MICLKLVGSGKLESITYTSREKVLVCECEVKRLGVEASLLAFGGAMQKQCLWGKRK